MKNCTTLPKGSAYYKALMLIVAAFLLSTIPMQAQLTPATCTPLMWYGRMCIDQFVLNGTTVNNACTSGGSNIGVTDLTSTSFTMAPGQTGNFSIICGDWFGDINSYQQYVYVLADLNNDGDFVDTGENLFGTSTPLSTSGGSLSGSFTVPSNTVAGPKRLRVIAQWTAYGWYGWSPCLQTGYGDCLEFTMNVIYNNDANLVNVSTTTPPPFPAGSNNIVANITNSGGNTINSMVLNYTITPSAGAAITGSVNYNTPITSGSSAPVTIYANYNFAAIGSANVSVTVSSVNGTTDPNPANNSGSALLGAGLSGTYTVGGSNPDFLSIKQAADQLTAGGTIGPVTFNIRPGTYTENVYIGPFPANQSTRPVVFQSENQNANTCVLQYSGSTSPAGNTGVLLNSTSMGGTPTLRMNNADFVSFKYMTLASLNSAFNTIVELCGPASTPALPTQAYGGCDNVSFDNVIFNAQVNTGGLVTFADVVFVSINGTINSNLTINNCTFNNGACQMYVRRDIFSFVSGSGSFVTLSAPPPPHSNTRITNNSFNNYGAFPLRYDNSIDAKITGNTWISNNTVTQRGIMFTQNEGDFSFSKNRVMNPVASNFEALFFGTRTNNSIRSLVSNNFIQVPSGGGWAMNNSNASNTDYMHNTVYVVGAGAAFNVPSGLGATITNNIFYNAGSGPAVSASSGAVTSMNYNSLYSAGATLGVWNGASQASLAAWRTASGQDGASSSTAITFSNVAQNNLSLTAVNPLLFGIGSTSNGTFTIGVRNRVPDDIYGTTRSRTEVYMGAHQLSPVISINPAPPATISGCQNQTLVISANASVSYGAQMTFSWQRNGAPLINGVNGVSGADTKDLTITNAQPSLNGGDYVLRVTATGGADPVVTNIVSVTIDSPIEIKRQPEARILCRNNETAVSVVASGTILGYQWQKEGVNIVGATGPVYVINNADFVHSGRYRCVLSGTCGTTTVFTDDAVIYVASNTLIGRHPMTKGAAVGSTGYLDLEVNATAQVPGYSPQFQWYQGTTMLSDNGRITGTTTNQLTIRNMTTADITQNYTCVVTGICGTQTSSQGGFYVSQIDIASQPQNVDVCTGTDGALQVVASSNIPGVKYSYEWRKDGNIISNGGKYSGATTNVLTVKGATATEAGDYTVTVTANPGGANITSGIAKLNILSTPTVTTQPLNVTVCEGQPASMNVVAAGGGLSYQWKIGGVDVPGATDASVSVPNALSSMNGAKVTVVVRNNCGNVTSSEATLTVNTKPVITSQPEAKAIHVTGDYVLSVTATGATEYQWKKDGASIPGANSATYTIRGTLSVGEKAGTYVCEVKNGCGSVETNGAAITVTSTDEEAVAAGYGLKAVEPMPLSGVGRISFTLPVPGYVTIVLRDGQGRTVSTLYSGTATDGVHAVSVNSEELVSGVYTYTLTSGKYSITQRMVVIK